jgi:hypothetical protein
MDLQTYQAYTQQLTRNCEALPAVIGLVACGSMAALHRRDEWSDHDFFVVVESGQQEHFRTHLAWLPDADHIIMAFRETEHGLKVMYDSAHLIEFAVFDVEELRQAKANDYAVLLDRDSVATTMTTHVVKKERPPRNLHQDFLQTLSLMQVGASRYARGERLSSHVFLKAYTLMHLLPVLAHYLPSDTRNKLDNLDSFRRFEQAFPTVGQAINEALTLSPLACAQRLLEIADASLAHVMPAYPAQVVATVQTYLQKLTRHIEATDGGQGQSELR